MSISHPALRHGVTFFSIGACRFKRQLLRITFLLRPMLLCLIHWFARARYLWRAEPCVLQCVGALDYVFHGYLIVALVLYLQLGDLAINIPKVTHISGNVA